MVECIKMTCCSLDVYVGMWLSDPSAVKSADPFEIKTSVGLRACPFSCVTQAFDEDEKGNVEDAIELYAEAVNLSENRMYKWNSLGLSLVELSKKFLLTSAFYVTFI